MQNKQKVQQAVEYVRKFLQDREQPQAAVVLGTGLGGLVEHLENPLWLDCKDIPGFPVSTVDSHAGQLGHGWLSGVPVVVQSGRTHLYEGYGPDDVVMGVRTMAGFGARTLIVASAAGGLNPQFDAGAVMLMTDQINFTGQSPLTGPNVDAWGPRFPDMSRVFSRRLQNLARQTAIENAVALERGVYVGVRGPQLETPAETRVFRLLGADVIGMSTVLETMAAHHMGLEILGFAIVTNKNLPDCMEETSLEAIIETAKRAGGELTRLALALAPRLPKD